MLKSSKTLKSNKLLKRSGFNLTKRSTLKKSKIKKSTQPSAWQLLRSKIIEDFDSKGIVTCELKFEGCTEGLFLTLAHSLKRRFIKTEEELKEVILACQNCHDKIEYRKDMTDIVREVIKKRS